MIVSRSQSTNANHYFGLRVLLSESSPPYYYMKGGLYLYSNLSVAFLA